jgi:glutamate-1-semialdehyde 2,1-aminomutase
LSQPIDRQRLAELTEQERARFVETHPRSREIFERSQRSLLGGVPMGWMTYWPSPFPVVVREGRGARFVDVDGHEYTDYCLGEGAALLGHAPDPVVAALSEQARQGLSFMLPSEDATWVGEALAERFGPAKWHFALSATDANRFVLRLLRAVTGRDVVLVFKGCYHGTLEEMADAQVFEAFDHAPGGPIPQRRVRAVEFNDVAALAEALAPGDVACVMTEPALTNIGTILPEPGYHHALRELTRQAGTLLVYDETHTLAAGPGGCTRLWGLEPDALTLGKAIGSGMPAAAYGFTAELAERLETRHLLGIDGTGGTIAGSALSVAAMRASIEHVVTEAAFARSIPLAERFVAGVERVIRERGLPWHTVQLGCRAEYAFSAEPARNQAHSLASGARDTELSKFFQLHALNRGIVLVPFESNVALVAPTVSEAEIDRHTAVFAEAVAALVG